MSNARKLQAEIDRTLKKVDEGVELFDQVWDKVYSAPSQAQKEKYEGDLKKEIKRLQRLREQIKNWASNSDVKVKQPLLDARRLIETKMEAFKECERETKTKAYSKEGLARAALMDPAEIAKQESLNFLQETISRLEEFVDECETEIEQLMAKKRPDRDAVAAREETLGNHKFHIEKLEMLQRMLDNDAITVEQIDALKDDLDYYLESCNEDDFYPDLDIYDTFEELGSTPAPTSPPKKKAAAAPAPASGKASSSKKSPAKSASSSKASAAATKSSTLSGKSSGKGAAASSSSASSSSSSSSSSSAAAAASASSASSSSSSSGSTKGSKVATPLRVTHKAPKAMAPTPTNPPKTTPSVSMATILKGKSAAASGPTPVSAAAAVMGGGNGAPSAAQRLAASTAAAGGANGGRRGVGGPQAAASSASGPSSSSSSTSSTSAAAVVAAGGARNTGGPTAASVVAASAASASSASSTAAAAAATPGSGPPSSFALSASGGSNAVASGIPTSAGVTGSVGGMSTASALGGPASAAAVAPAAGGAAAVVGGAAAAAAAAAATATASAPAPAVAAAPVERAPVLRPAELQRNLALLNSSIAHIPEARDSERPKMYTPRNPHRTHPSFPQAPATHLDTAAAFEKLDTDTLFFVFYYQQGTYQQYLAARELKKQSWRFHKKYSTWFQRHEEPKTTTDEYECGTYVYFDYETGWCQRIKREFTFEYHFLEDSLGN